MVLNQSLKKVLIKKFYDVGLKVNDCNAFFENSYDKIVDNDYNDPFFKKAVFKVKALLNEVDKFNLFIAKFYDDHPEFHSYGSIGVRLGNLFSSSSRR